MRRMRPAVTCSVSVLFSRNAWFDRAEAHTLCSELLRTKKAASERGHCHWPLHHSGSHGKSKLFPMPVGSLKRGGFLMLTTGTTTVCEQGTLV